MAIRGIGQYSYGFSPVQRKEQTEEVNTAPVSAVPDIDVSSDAAGNNGAGADSADSLQEVAKAPRQSDPSDFLFDFKRNNSFNLIAATNDTEDIDVDKALDDMQKDAVLVQYKYFVGPTNLGTDQDGTVRMVQR